MKYYLAKYYLAYGSNLNVSHMMHRCPDAVPIGTAEIKDWRLTFRYHATIEPCKPEIHASVPVGVWAITNRDEQMLDMYEGFPEYYEKRNMTVDVRLRSGKTKKVTAMVYIMLPGHPICPPAVDYFNAIQIGYKDFDLVPDKLNYAMYDAVYIYGLNDNKFDSGDGYG